MKNPLEDSVRKKESHSYVLDLFTVGEEGIEKRGKVDVAIVRGSKIDKENADNNIEKQDGVLVEQLLSVCKDHLENVNTGAFRNRDSSIAITHIEDALLRLQKRSDDRSGRGVLGTYQK